MKILIIAAMSKELALLVPLLQDCKRHERENDIVVYIGKVGANEVIATQCGIGKVNSALMTNDLITMYKPDLVINSGVAGGTGNGVGICDVVVAEGVAYHDVWCGPGTEWGQAYGMPRIFEAGKEILKKAHSIFDKNTKVHFGLICSGDIFVSRPEEVAHIKRLFPHALAVDMESASIAHVCARRHVPFIAIRAVSDTPGEGENISQYEGFWEKAPRETFELVRQLLK